MLVVVVEIKLTLMRASARGGSARASSITVKQRGELIRKLQGCEKMERFQ
jgi:hypothetical protein